MTAPRKLYQVALVDHPAGFCVVYRLDNGTVLYRVVNIASFEDDQRNEWRKIEPPPGLRIGGDGDNGGPDLDEEPRRRRY
jgi:hypothetical protein